MLVAAAATPRPLLSSLTIPEGDGPRARAAVTAGEKSVSTVAGAPLEQAVAYANSLVNMGWAGTVGVLQAQDGWKLVALETGEGAFELDARRGTVAGAVDRLQRHTYDLAAVVGATSFATWTGRQRISELFTVSSPVKLPATTR